jgi:alpha-L-fucosidase
VIPRFNDGRDWFFKKRFGLFIHWGLYSIERWHEQHQFRLGVPRREYEKLIHQFNPTRFDPNAWLDLAESAGMQYLTLTTKHQDGFCLWNTAQTTYNVMRAPYGKDIVRILADACHRRNFPLCLYYSLVDNHHPNYPNQGRGHELPAPEPGDQPDVSRYMEFVKAQVRELCTQYGELHGFWWDVNDMQHNDPLLNEMIRELQPGIIINNRGCGPGDCSTPERDWDRSVDEDLAFTKPTEACQSVGVESWGCREDEDYYTERHLIHSIDKICAKGGNYLLNVGPLADGTIPEKSASLLRVIGKWYTSVRESFEGTEPATHLTTNRDVLLTKKGETLYVHLAALPASNRVVLAPLARVPRRATLLNTGAPVESSVDLLPSNHRTKDRVLRLKNLPANECANTVLVVKLEF